MPDHLKCELAEIACFEVALSCHWQKLFGTLRVRIAHRTHRECLPATGVLQKQNKRGPCEQLEPEAVTTAVCRCVHPAKDLPPPARTHCCRSRFNLTRRRDRFARAIIAETILA